MRRVPGGNGGRERIPVAVAFPALDSRRTLLGTCQGDGRLQALELVDALSVDGGSRLGQGTVVRPLGEYAEPNWDKIGLP